MNARLFIKRKEKRLNQTDIAKMLFITRQTYHLKETGKREFTIREGKRLANYYGCTLDELFN